MRAPFRRLKKYAQTSLAELIRQEKRRAQIHIKIIRYTEPDASSDRLSEIMLSRWTKLASIEGGMTGAAGVLGIPTNLLLFSYCQLAAAVSVAEAYNYSLEGRAGEDAILALLGDVHGINDLVRSGPRVFGALAKTIALRHSLPALGRAIPLVAAPISAKLNERDMRRLGREARRIFGHVVEIA